MTAEAVPAQLHEVVTRARRSRMREHLARLDSLRALREASELGATQAALAAQLRVTQPSISSALKTARDTPRVPEGFSGASPYEIAERFATGELTPAEVIDELARWPYRPGTPSDGVDWLTLEPGEWNDQVVPAWDEGLITDEIYAEVQRRRDEIGR